MRKVVLYIACSMDGYIASPGDDLDFLSVVEEEGEDYGYAQFNSTVDTVILGGRTYDWVVNQGHEFPHHDKDAYVITRTPRESNGKVRFYPGDLADLVNGLKSLPGKDIFCDGGAWVANELMKRDLIDAYIISVIPVMLGDGIRLFDDRRPQQELKLVSAKSFEAGLVQLHYERKRSQFHVQKL
jgi:dihydrofolate reductase